MSLIHAAQVLALSLFTKLPSLTQYAFSIELRSCRPGAKGRLVLSIV